ncbi:MAG: cellobiose phosphorylase, partial [Candidatus Omnitrophota bacterium]
NTDTKLYEYLEDGVTFQSAAARGLKLIYAPLCGTTSSGIKSAITPRLSGDIKIDRNRYVTKPVSREDLRQPLRNFFLHIKGKGIISLADNSGKAVVRVGLLWHILEKTYPSTGLEIQALNFVPVTGENAELMRVTVKNTGKKDLEITPTFAIPLFGRALANKQDHEHVTALLNRIEQLPDGVMVKPVMIFNEEGHIPCEAVYYALGADSSGKRPEGTFPTVESFCGHAGDFAAPEAVLKNSAPALLGREGLEGKEAAGAIRFKTEILKKGRSKVYIMVFGAARSRDEAIKTFTGFGTPVGIEAAWAKNKKWWDAKSSSITFGTGNSDFNSWARWVTIQPVLRRIFGCSFLPDHDYGKGGKGWRDIWQDLLSLILIEPDSVKKDIVNNFGGVRIDGSNATIIGPAPGEFVADRNAITRVWMDHGVWPFMTTLLYINQTGDYGVLLEKMPYFRDPQLSRAHEKDLAWKPAYGKKLKTRTGAIYSGTVLEHILVQHLTQFFNVGEHNNIRLECADWNDGLDMAAEKGESVAFTSMYAANMLALADLLEDLAGKKRAHRITVARETLILMDSVGKHPCDYNRPDKKRGLLFKRYFPAVQPEISGKTASVPVQDIIKDLRRKGRWIFSHIKKHEHVTVSEKGARMTWMNGYYDNKGRRVEGKTGQTVRMTLTGQAFPIMSGLTDVDETAGIIRSVCFYLKDSAHGGYRLNTDFGLDRYPDLGRAFSFAYGTKENGAFFSHMAVMYAYALYSRGFAREGRAVLDSIYRMCANTEKSQIYPGIPEYFDSNGQGMYHYLTGSASWFVLTELTQVFGARGGRGDLIINPKLLREEFSRSGRASATFTFAGRRVRLSYLNPDRIGYGRYRISGVTIGGKAVLFETLSPNNVRVERKTFLRHCSKAETPLDVTLSRT